MSFLQNIGSTEIIIIAIVILVFFGGKKMNEWAKGLGEAGRELKKAKQEFETAFTKEEMETLDKKKRSSSKSSTRKEVA